MAWKLYVELKTRKAALPFDEENDLIAEVYDSLYELFPITRQLLAALPLGEAQRPTGIADLMMRVQNDGLRPHLTRWQAAFRRWWDKAVEVPENEGKSPQELQRQYPLYTDLVADLKRTNDDLSKYAEELLKIVRSSGPKFPKPRIRGRKAARPIPPSTRVATSSLGVGSRRESGSPPVPDDQGGGQL